MNRYTVLYFSAGNDITDDLFGGYACDVCAAVKTTGDDDILTVLFVSLELDDAVQYARDAAHDNDGVYCHVSEIFEFAEGKWRLR